jgi:hypothetical protein
MRFHAPVTGCEGRRRRSIYSRRGRSTAWCAKEEFMSFDFLLGGATFVGLLAYLLFALVRCERF